MCGARRNSKRNWSICTRIRCRESWCNIRRTGLGAVGRTTRGRERVEFGLIQTEESTWKQQVRGRVKTRTLNTEGCGTPPKSKPTAKASPPATPQSQNQLLRVATRRASEDRLSAVNVRILNNYAFETIAIELLLLESQLSHPAGKSAPKSAVA